MNNNKPDVNLNLNVRGLPTSATIKINEKSNELIKEGRKVCKLGLGQSPFPVPNLVVEELIKHARKKDYLPVKGLPQLRDAVAGYHRRHHGINRTADDVLIGPGSKELMFLMQYVYYGDLVIPTPSWVSYAPQAHIIGRPVRWIPTKRENNWRLTAEELRTHCSADHNKPRIVILNYPSNPVGSTYTKKELEEIADVANEHKIILLSDEIYGELHHKGEHISIACFYPEGTIISGGLSKWCGAGGWRLGTFTFPKSLRWLQDSMAVMASETFTSTSAPIQYAAVKAFVGDESIEKYLWRSRWILDKLGNKISKMLIDAGVYAHNPEGAFYLFPDFSDLREHLSSKGINTSVELCNKILVETGVAILPGSSFGRPETELTARIAYVDFDGVAVMESALKLNSVEEVDDNFIAKHCEEMISSIENMINWISA